MKDDVQNIIKQEEVQEVDEQYVFLEQFPTDKKVNNPVCFSLSVYDSTYLFTVHVLLRHALIGVFKALLGNNPIIQKYL